MNSKAAIVIVVILAAVGIFLYEHEHQHPRGHDDHHPGAMHEHEHEHEHEHDHDSGGLRVTMVYSSEKKAWLEGAAQGFKKEHPEINLNLVSMGSFESAQAILDGKQQPTVWSPADSLGLEMLRADWKTKHGSDLFAQSGDDAPQSLLITPLVFVVWEDRAHVLLQGGKEQLSWKLINKAVSSNQGWLSVGGKPEWGFVKLGHTDPTRSNSGLQALLLMTLDFYGKTSGLTVGDLLRQDYQDYLRSIEKGVSKFETSTGTFMTDMIRFGPSKYDIALVYESLAISQIDNAQGRWGNLRVYYPSLTQWSDHPAALISADWVTPEQQKAARLWLAYLHSRPLQERALTLGFRPADTSVPLKNADPQNPFVKHIPFGIKLEIPQVAPPPDVSVVRNMTTLWSRLIGTR